MTDHNKKPRMWADVIKAWADGAEVQYRIQVSSGNWGPWMSTTLPAFSFSLTKEYRVKPEQEPHKWQLQKEAFLAGKKVYFRHVAENVQHLLTPYFIKTFPDLWDMEHLEFTVEPDTEIRFAQAAMVDGRLHIVARPSDMANVKLTFIGGELLGTAVI